MFRKIKIMIENFLINEWNLYGLQFLSLFVILMMIRNIMDYKQVMDLWFVWMPALIIIGVYIKGVIEYEEDSKACT